MTALPEVGQLVYSRAGRDGNRPLVVVAVCDRRHVLVSDGQLRPSARPKRKNVRHLAPGTARHPGLAAGQVPNDAELRRWLRTVTTRVPGDESGSEEGRA